MAFVEAMQRPTVARAWRSPAARSPAAQIAHRGNLAVLAQSSRSNGATRTSPRKAAGTGGGGAPAAAAAQQQRQQHKRRRLVRPEVMDPEIGFDTVSGRGSNDLAAAAAAAASLSSTASLDGAGTQLVTLGTPAAHACEAILPGRPGLEGTAAAPAPVILIAKPLPRVLLLHCGGTLGMDPGQSYTEDLEGHVVLREGTGGRYHKTSHDALKPPNMLANLLTVVPELRSFAQLEVKVVMNKDSSNMGPKEWVQLAKTLHASRDAYDAFLIVHGTDTLAYSASALSLMLVGFRKPVVVTGSQLPLAMPRSDARQNLIDAITCATSGFVPPHVALAEVAVCFGGKLMRGNRVQKVSTSDYQAFASPSLPPLAQMGIDVSWQEALLLRPHGAYTPRFNLDPRVIRIPIVPGSDPRVAYGDLAERGVRGVVLEAFGTANMPNEPATGWLPWLRSQRRKGLAIHLSSQCSVGPLRPELYMSGSAALAMGVSSGPQMTPECSVVKMMMTLSYPDLLMGMPLAGEM